MRTAVHKMTLSLSPSTGSAGTPRDSPCSACEEFGRPSVRVLARLRCVVPHKLRRLGEVLDVGGSVADRSGTIRSETTLQLVASLRSMSTMIWPFVVPSSFVLGMRASRDQLLSGKWLIRLREILLNGGRVDGSM
eukprot:8804579-Heterocapsa_arctica.AAC.1